MRAFSRRFGLLLVVVVEASLAPRPPVSIKVSALVPVGGGAAFGSVVERVDPEGGRFEATVETACGASSRFSLPAGVGAALGGTLWPSAAAQAVLVSRWRAAVAGARVLELGAGLGLGGLVAAGVGGARDVVLTDNDAALLGELEATAALHAGPSRAPVAARALDWADPPLIAKEARFGVVLGADVAYNERTVPELLEAVAATRADDGLVVVVGEAQRKASAAFYEALLAKRSPGAETCALEYELRVETSAVYAADDGDSAFAPPPPPPTSSVVAIAVAVQGPPREVERLRAADARFAASARLSAA